MDFDHLDDKEFEISKAISRNINLQRILAEIEKCDLICANCHRARTYLRSKINH